MKILAIEKEIKGINPELFSLHAGEEAIKVWEYYQQGIIREIYFRNDRNEAVIILECNNEKEAKSILKTFPFVENGFIDFEIIPLKPYPGFERLFQKRN